MGSEEFDKKRRLTLQADFSQSSVLYKEYLKDIEKNASIRNEILKPKYEDHKLVGKYAGFRE